MLDWLFGRKELRLLEDRLEESRRREENLQRSFVNQEKFISDLQKKHQQELGSATKCVEAIMARGISWYDVGKLPYDQQLQYFMDAQALARDDVLLNEIQHLNADWLQFMATRAKDISMVRDMQISISATKLLLERLESIPDPRKHETSDELHSPI